MKPTPEQPHRPVPVVRDPALAAQRPFDLIVVGGGIYGIATALEAGRRNLRTLVLEKHDFAGATTANHLRTLHGGLRYLQTLDLARFNESVAERRWFSRHLPELVEPLPCLMPLYGRGVKRREVFFFGLMLNDLLSAGRNRGVSQDKRLPTGHIVSAAGTTALFPGVDPQGLQGSARWFDVAMPEPQRLVWSLLHSAATRGATFLNYTEAESLLVTHGRTIGVTAVDGESGRKYDFSAPLVVNAAGPGARALAARWDRDLPALFQRGLLLWNVLFRRPALSDHALALTPNRGRGHTYFLHTWKGRLLVGTGEYLVPEGDTGVAVPADRLAAMIDDLNRAVPGLGLTRAEVERVYAGQLPATPGGKLSNRPEIVDHRGHGGPAGLWSVTGVKFTTARRVAEALLTRLQPEAAAAPHHFPTGQTGPLYAYDWRPAPGDVAWLEPLRRLVENEAVLHLDDLLLRRTSLAENPGRAVELLPALRPLFPAWSDSRWLAETARVEQALVPAIGG